MVDPQPSRILPAILIVLVLVAAAVAVGLVTVYSHPTPTAPLRTVQIGDNVTVNYTGTFGSGPQQGHVFDTSIYAVATNNLSYPKSLEYTPRGAVSQYSPLPVHVGPNAPSGGYPIGSLTFQSVVTGFWQGLVGVPVGVAHTITVPPNLGYGPLDPACLVSQPLSLAVPAVIQVPAGNFSKDYPNVSAAPGTEFLGAPFAWPMVVLNVNASAVTLENLPSIGDTVRQYGLPYVVTAINASTVTVTSQLTTGDAGLVLGHGSGTVCGSTKFIVSAVDPASGTFTANFNSEVVGATLVFTVTVVQFY